ncbi:MAG: phenylacetate--CoA ligase [Christensenellaceae bacterium]|nr:phenylacetate--CoA ligase [Christensenellaceae bacterium]
MEDNQFKIIQEQFYKLKAGNGFYSQKFKDVEKLESFEDFLALPFTEKADLRNAYPLGLQAVDEDKIVRIHSSSGTTGTPVIIPYTQKDVDDWAEMFARCYEVIGVTSKDRIHITPGYGLWTAGIGFQAGAEKLGAMAIPMGPGNTDKQLKMMKDLGSTVLCATSSYALLLAEEIEKRGIRDELKLTKGLIGSERWGEKMRKRIANELGVELYDIYGLTEVYGPGIGVSCAKQEGIHMWTDYIYIEIINPKTGEVLPDGETGELVITTLAKEGAPLIRYRTHDLTRKIAKPCSCGLNYPLIDTILGRTDDMVKVKGVNIFPSQIDEMISQIPDASSEYQFMLDHLYGKDICTLFVEAKKDVDITSLEREINQGFKNKIGISVIVKIVGIGELPRSEKKSTRIFDNRY